MIWISRQCPFIKVCRQSRKTFLLLYCLFFCSTFAAYSCGAFAANAFFVFTFISFPLSAFCDLRRTIVAHCSGTQCAPQVCIVAHCSGTQFCGAQLSRTVLVHNVHRKFAAHSCRALFCVPQRAHSCRALRCSPHPPLPPQPPVYHPNPIYFFSSLPPGGVWEKNVGMVGVLQKSGGGDGKKCRGGGWYGLSEK